VALDGLVGVDGARWLVAAGRTERRRDRTLVEADRRESRALQHVEISKGIDKRIFVMSLIQNLESAKALERYSRMLV